MESQYNAQRQRNIFSVNDLKPYKLSRSRIEVYMRCKRCFYLDRKCGTEQPPMYPYTLNMAVDNLLKKEFDEYRIEGKSHPYLIENNIDAIPFSHPNLNDWRTNQRGIRYYHEATNFIVTGSVDDVWINSSHELVIVDYKATSVKVDPDIIDRASYKRQMEIYQWLFRKNGFEVSEIGYFVYCNGDTNQARFQDKLLFKTSLLPYRGNDSWVEKTLLDIKECLSKDELPLSSEDCDYCNYIEAVNKHIQKYPHLKN